MAECVTHTANLNTQEAETEAGRLEYGDSLFYIIKSLPPKNKK